MFALALLGCIQHLDQIGGTGSIYTTKCTADMDPGPRGYEAACTPPTCREGYTDAGISHVGMALDPGRRIIGVAERACVQDLSVAARQFEAPDVQQLAVPEPAAEPAAQP